MSLGVYPLLGHQHPTPLLAALPIPFWLSGASSFPLRGLSFFHPLLLLVAIAVQRAGGGSGGRARGAGPNWLPLRSHGQSGARPPPPPPRGRALGSRLRPGGAAGRAGELAKGTAPPPAARRGFCCLAMPPWGAALALLLAALALLGLFVRRLRRPERRAVGARTLLGDRGQDDDEEVDRGGLAHQCSDEREPLPGGCRLICKSSALAQCLLRALRRSAALEPGPRSWLSGPHLQTLRHFVLPAGPEPELAREYLQLADDGLVALDWVVGPCARGRRVSNAGGLPAVLLVIPNAWGRLTRNVLGLCLLALERGYYPVIFHRRGHHGCPLVSPRLQPFGDPSDLKEAVTYIRFRHPAAPLFAVSEGSGSALLLSYLGECGSSSYMTGAACISPVLRCREWFEAGLPWPYERGFLLHQKIALSRLVREATDGQRENRGWGLIETQLCLVLRQTGLGQFGQSSPHAFSEAVQALWSRQNRGSVFKRRRGNQSAS